MDQFDLSDEGKSAELAALLLTKVKLGVQLVLQRLLAPFVSFLELFGGGNSERHLR